LGWGESAARSVVIWSVVGGVALLFLLAFLVGDFPDEPDPNLRSIVYWTGFGVVFGIWWRALAIRIPESTHERNPSQTRPDSADSSLSIPRDSGTGSSAVNPQGV
jgi:hypothetical protein